MPLEGTPHGCAAVGETQLTDPTVGRVGHPLDEALLIDEDRAKLMRKWAKRMDKVLPPRLLVRYFQLENKFHAIVAADLAHQIPLVP